jgi:hypothetical protein
VPLIVRNTFIDIVGDRPLSFDEFFVERRINSCPVEPQIRSEVVDDELTSDLQPQALHRAATVGVTDIASAANSALAAARTYFGDAPEQVEIIEDTLAGQWNAPARQILTLSEALPMPDPCGTPYQIETIPSLGSAGHQIGTCQPCAFFHKQGCGNGAQCSFCHLCGPGEKKKRQKEKIAALRNARQRNAMNDQMVYL